MKIGKQAKRFGGPSRKHLESREAARAAALLVPPADGPVRLYLDDERPCPEGWTLARSSSTFRDLVEATADRLEALSLDWYMGGRGVANADVDAQWLADRLTDDPEAFPALQSINFHSSDDDKALAMLRIVRAALKGERRYEVMLVLGAIDGPRRR